MSSANWQTISHVMELPDQGQRLDKWLRREYPGWSISMLQKMLRQGDIRLNGKKCKTDVVLSEHDVITIRVTAQFLAQATTAPTKSAKQEIEISQEEAKALQAQVIFKDAHMIALNKPAGLAVQGGSKQSKHLDGMLRALCFDAKEPPRLVHRLDQDTSGVLLLARHRQAAQKLGDGFKHKTIRKIYWALVDGHPERAVGSIDVPLSKRGGAGQQERVQPDPENGQEALTHYRVVERLAPSGRRPALAWVEMMPITGRTHQLRVHMAAIGHPIIGDGKYGGRDAHVHGLDGQLHLHARAVEMARGAKPIHAPLPAHMQKSWELLELPTDDSGVNLFELSEIWDAADE